MTSAIEDQLIEAWWISIKTNSSQYWSTGKLERGDLSNPSSKTSLAPGLLPNNKRAKNHLRLSRWLLIHRFNYRNQHRKNLNKLYNHLFGNIKTQNLQWLEEAWSLIVTSNLSNSIPENLIFLRKLSFLVAKHLSLVIWLS